MTTIHEQNEQAKIIWDVLYACEVQAALRNFTEKQKRDFIIKRAKNVKNSKRHAYLTLKRVANSGKISHYVDAISTEISAQKS